MHDQHGRLLHHVVLVLPFAATTSGVSKEDLSPSLSSSLALSSATFYPALEESSFDSALRSVPLFCFPDMDDDALSLGGPEHGPSEVTDFVLTDALGDRLFCSSLRLAAPSASSEFGCVVVVSRWRHWGALHACLDVLYAASNGKISHKLEPQIHSLLQDVPLPQPFLPLEIKLASESVLVERQGTLYTASDAAIQSLFEQLSIHTVLSIFAALLTQTPVVVHSTNPAILVPLCEAMLSLLHPFTYEDVYVPLLPLSMSEILDAPTIFFIGAITDAVQQHAISMAGDVMVVCLETDSVQNDPGVLPEPHRRVLTAALRRTLFPRSTGKDTAAATGGDIGRLRVLLTGYMALLLAGCESYHTPHSPSLEAESSFETEKYVHYKAGSDPSIAAFVHRMASSIGFQRFVHREDDAYHSFEAPHDALFERCMGLAADVDLSNPEAVTEYLYNTADLLNSAIDSEAAHTPFVLPVADFSTSPTAASGLSPSLLLCVTAKLNDASLGALERAHLLRLRGLLHWQQQSHVAAIYDLLSVNRAVLDDVLLSPQCLYHFFAMLSSSEQMQVSVRCEHALAAWPVAQRRRFTLAFREYAAIVESTPDPSSGHPLALLLVKLLGNRPSPTPAPEDSPVASKPHPHKLIGRLRSIVNLDTARDSKVASRAVLLGTTARKLRVEHAIRYRQSDEKRRKASHPGIGVGSNNAFFSGSATLMGHSGTAGSGRPLQVSVARHPQHILSHSVLLIKRQAMLISSIVNPGAVSADFRLDDASRLRACSGHPSFEAYAESARLLVDFDVSVLSMRERAIFFLNVATSMNVHAVIDGGNPPTFFDRVRGTLPTLCIGDEMFSADDILYTILRLTPPASSIVSEGTRGRDLTIAIDDAIEGDNESVAAGPATRKMSCAEDRVSLANTTTPVMLRRLSLALTPIEKLASPTPSPSTAVSLGGSEPEVKVYRDFVPRALHRLMYFCYCDCTAQRPSLEAFDEADFEERVLEISTQFLDRNCLIDEENRTVAMPLTMQWYCKDVHGSEADMLAFFGEFLLASSLGALAAKAGAQNIKVEYKQMNDVFALTFDSAQFYH